MPVHEGLKTKYVTRHNAGLVRKLDKAAASKTLTLTDYAYALEQCYGVVGEAAKMLGLNVAVMKRKIEITPSLDRLQKQLIQARIDKAELELAKQVDDGVLPAITFTLKTLGKERGYTEKNEVEHSVDPNNIRDAASLIAAMQRGAGTITKLEEEKSIDVKDYTCLEPSATKTPDSSDPKS